MSVLGRQFPVPIPEGTNIKYSGGLGQLEGDETHNITAMLPISQVKKYVEYDRLGKQEIAGVSKETIDDLTNHLKNGGVIKEPLMLEHNTETQWGYLGEGHHRLIAAERAGLTHVPVFVYSGGNSFKFKKYKASGVGAPLTLGNPQKWANFPGDYYQPKELHPGHFKEFQ